MKHSCTSILSYSFSTGDFQCCWDTFKMINYKCQIWPGSLVKVHQAKLPKGIYLAPAAVCMVPLALADIPPTASHDVVVRGWRMYPLMLTFSEEEEHKRSETGLHSLVVLFLHKLVSLIKLACEVTFSTLWHKHRGRLVPKSNCLHNRTSLLWQATLLWVKEYTCEWLVIHMLI